VTFRQVNGELDLGCNNSRSEQAFIQDFAPSKKENVIKVFAPDCADQSLDEWMRSRRIGDGLDLIDFKDPKISLQSMVSK